MNKKNLKATADFMEKELEFPFDMDSMCIPSKSCGTAGCIAGFATVALNLLPRERASFADPAVIDCLGLTFDEFCDLCYPEGLEYSEITREMAISTLRHAAATGKIEWPDSA